MKRLAIIILTVLLCGAAMFMNFRSVMPESETVQAETIHYTDISSDYLFVQNLSETERMVHSLQDYLKDGSIQIQPSVPDDVIAYYAESTWDPAKAASIPGGAVYCVEAWDIFKNGEFQKTSYLAGRICGNHAVQ